MSAPPNKKLRQTSITDSFKFTAATRMQNQQASSGEKEWKNFDFFTPNEPTKRPQENDKDTISHTLVDDKVQKVSSEDIIKERADVANPDNMGVACLKSATITPSSPNHANSDPVSTTDIEATLENSQPRSPSPSQHCSAVKPPKSFGADLKLKRMEDCFRKEFPKLKSDDHHYVLINPDTIKVGSKTAPAAPRLKTDRWDQNHVRMPCSGENLYPVEADDGGKNIMKRWEMIDRELKSLSAKREITVFDIQDAILSYNKRYQEKWDFSLLQEYEKLLLNEEQQTEFMNTIQQMAHLAIQLPEICTQPIPLLKRHSDKSVTMSQRQISCLLANAFFCTFPRRNEKKKGSEYASYPDINFNRLFSAANSDADGHMRVQKLRCLMNYFKRVTDKEPVGTLTFKRVRLRKEVRWDRSTTSFRPQKLRVTSEGTIEDQGKGMLQVDFANKSLGGGVLGHGCVQEEIRFVICPELIVSRLFTENLEDDECLIMTGCEQYSSYCGYGSTFEFVENYEDKTPLDAWGRRCTEVVAIDALHFRQSDTSSQFKYRPLLRELCKAYCGFSSQLKGPLPAIATGNWGCGAFGGDPWLKAIIQLMAAAEARRDVCYFTFGNPDLAEDIYKFHEYVKKNNMTVGEVWKRLQEYSKIRDHLYGQNVIDFFLGEDVYVPNHWKFEKGKKTTNVTDHWDIEEGENAIDVPNRPEIEKGEISIDYDGDFDMEDDPRVFTQEEGATNDTHYKATGMPETQV